MPYNFTFDLGKVWRGLIAEITKNLAKSGVHKKTSRIAKNIVRRLNLDSISGLPISNLITVVEDTLDIFFENINQRDRFINAKGKRALLLPHCARKYMDNRCKAKFDGLAYICQSCSKDCLINRACKLAKKYGYDVYILPGGSCIPKILEKGYSAIVGVACNVEIKLGSRYLKSKGIPWQGVPLTKNGCSNTRFDLELLERVMKCQF